MLSKRLEALETSSTFNADWRRSSWTGWHRDGCNSLNSRRLSLETTHMFAGDRKAPECIGSTCDNLDLLQLNKPGANCFACPSLEWQIIGCLMRR